MLGMTIFLIKGCDLNCRICTCFYTSSNSVQGVNGDNKILELIACWQLLKELHLPVYNKLGFLNTSCENGFLTLLLSCGWPNLLQLSGTLVIHPDPLKRVET